MFYLHIIEKNRLTLSQLQEYFSENMHWYSIKELCVLKMVKVQLEFRTHAVSSIQMQARSNKLEILIILELESPALE